MDRSAIFTGTAAFCSILSIVFAFLAAHWSKREQRAREDKTPQWVADTQNQLKRMEGQLGNDAMTQSYLGTQRNLTQQYAEAMVGTAFEKFINGKSEREKLQDGIRNANAQLLTEIKFRFQPVNDLFLGMVDGWVSELTRRKVKVVARNLNDEFVVTDVTLRAHHWVREVEFENGAKIHVFLLPALIQDGRFASGYQIAIQYDLPNGSDGYQCSVDMTDGRYRLDNDKQARYTFAPYEKIAGTSPSEDGLFLECIRTAINQVMGYLTETNAGL